ncbi:MAG TPA: SDR family oxidoreductase [Candidatus Eisenbacteria bacterium]|nr:SDR family oxidoreductase [Candidatus Eisenbacteria bacterium]
MQPNAIFPDLAGKVVFITGGASGIGSALVRAFCQQGARVAFVDILEEESQKLAEEVSAGGPGSVRFQCCDLRDTAALAGAIEKTGVEIGKIAVLVNNAGNDDRHEFGEVTQEYWDGRIELNLRHYFFACQAVFPQMKEQKLGSIINLGSIIWKIKQDDAPIYSTCKAAIHGLTRALATRFGAHGIRVNTISPGAVWTERQIRLWYTPEMEEKMNANQCLKVKLLPEDIADLALFLASDASAKCTAQDFVVDAGWS